MEPAHSPLASFGRIERLLLRAAMIVEQHIAAAREAGEQAEGEAGAVQHLLEQDVDHVRHALAAMLRLAVSAGQPPATSWA